MTIYFPNTLLPSRSQTRLWGGSESHLPSRGGWGIEIIFHYPTPNEKPNKMLVDDLDSAAPSWKKTNPIVGETVKIWC